MPFWFPLLFLGVGGVFLVVGVGMPLRDRSFKRRARRADGIVAANLVESSGTYSSSNYRPVLRFITAEGRDVETPGQVIGLVFALARPGSRVTVYYDPADPTKARIGDGFVPSGGCLWAFMWLLGSIFLGTGCLVLAIVTAA
jgi:hypothetical protein